MYWSVERFYLDVKTMVQILLLSEMIFNLLDNSLTVLLILFTLFGFGLKIILEFLTLFFKNVKVHKILVFFIFFMFSVEFNMLKLFE